MASNEAQYDYIFKIVIIGDLNVGKTCLLLRYADDAFSKDYKATIGVDFKIRSVLMDGRRVKLNIWDTAGTERFRTLLCNYYRGAHGVILVYDVTDKESFASLQGWIEDVDRNINPDVNKLLVGNKCDLVAERQVEFKQAKTFADQHSIPYIETSAQDSINVDEAFLTMTADMVESRGIAQIPLQGDYMQSIRLGKSTPAVNPEGYYSYCCR